MCFADGSLAPAPPGARAAGPQRALTLVSTDGTAVAAHECLPETVGPVGIVVLPDVRGLHHYYRDLTVRLAEAGWSAVAIDYFARTAPDGDRSDDFVYMPHVQQTTPEGIAADVQAAVGHLAAQGCTSVFTLGFCFGGSYSWRQSAETAGLAGCVGFYGRASMVLPVVPAMTAPLLMLVAGADAHIPVEDTRQVAEAAPVEAEFVVFDGMPHSFFDRTSPEHADACREAWERIAAFVAAHA